ncbi:MAG: N-formylglutamate amidohydrolase [Devosia sp.]
MRSDYWDRPAFETVRPRRLMSPAVFNSAHSGRDYPERFLTMTRLDQLSIRQSEDAYVDDLFSRAPHAGAPLLRAHFPRAYLDVNREPWELDPTMFTEPLSERFNTTSPRVAAGIGTLAKVVAENKPIYREPLTLEDAQMRIEGIYHPYHSTLQRLLTDAISSFGIAVLVDCHSMPRIARSGDRAAPDIVLGDRYGTTCATGIVDLVEMIFAGAGLRVARNRPYAGGFIARTYGRPQHGVHALQVEISRHLYMNEETLEKTEGYAAMRQIIERLTLALIGIDLVALIRATPSLPRAAESAPQRKWAAHTGGPSQGRNDGGLQSAQRRG